MGFVYIMGNVSMPGIYKIGKTDTSAEMRAQELYTTGVPTPFELVAVYEISDSTKLERHLHRVMLEFRVSRSREFFRIDPYWAQTAVVDFCASTNIKLGPASSLLPELSDADEKAKLTTKRIAESEWQATKKRVKDAEKLEQRRAIAEAKRLEEEKFRLRREEWEKNAPIREAEQRERQRLQRESHLTHWMTYYAHQVPSDIKREKSVKKVSDFLEGISLATHLSARFWGNKDHLNNKKEFYERILPGLNYRFYIVNNDYCKNVIHINEREIHGYDNLLPRTGNEINDCLSVISTLNSAIFKDGKTDNLVSYFYKRKFRTEDERRSSFKTWAAEVKRVDPSALIIDISDLGRASENHFSLGIL